MRRKERKTATLRPPDNRYTAAAAAAGAHDDREAWGRKNMSAPVSIPARGRGVGREREQESDSIRERGSFPLKTLLMEMPERAKCFHALGSSSCSWRSREREREIYPQIFLQE